MENGILCKLVVREANAQFIKTLLWSVATLQRVILLVAQCFYLIHPQCCSQAITHHLCFWCFLGMFQEQLENAQTYSQKTRKLL